METRKLELKDICGYLPYDLKLAVYRGETTFIGNCYGSIDHYLRATDDFDNDEIYCEESEDMKPILRPISDLYKTITHNGKEIVPIVELAKMAVLKIKYESCWVLDDNYAVQGGDIYFSFEKEGGFWCFIDTSKKTHGNKIYNQFQLFDYLHELKIDYRGLIDEGLAIDVNTLDKNPYK